MLATQAQEFWGGRWALAARTQGRPERARRRRRVRPRRDRPLVDDARHDPRHPRARPRVGAVAHRRAAVSRRPRRCTASRAIDAAELAQGRAPRARARSRGGNRLDPQGAVRRARGGRRLDRAASAATTCSSRCRCAAVVCQGPVVPREGGPTREQYFVLHRRVGDGCRVPGRSARRVLRPLHRLARPGRRARLRVVVGSAARGLAGRGGGGIRSPRRRRRRRRAAVRRRRPGARGAAPRRPRCSRCRRSRSTTSRTPTARCRARRSSSRAIGPSMNGIVRPILVARGEVVGVWTHSLAVGPARRRTRSRAVRAGCRDGCRGRRGPRPLPRLHHGLSAPRGTL